MTTQAYVAASGWLYRLAGVEAKAGLLAEDLARVTGRLWELEGTIAATDLLALDDLVRRLQRLAAGVEAGGDELALILQGLAGNPPAR